MEYYFQRYGDLELHRRMIGDRRRTDAYAEAINQEVTAGDVVLDVGTGTGLLAMLAAKAGARRVYGIDQAEIAQTAANLVKVNGLDGVVEILRGPAAELVLDEKASVIVSEWMGNLAFVEAMLDDLIAARDNNLATGGRLIPYAVEVLLAPIDDPVLYGVEGPGFWRNPVVGLDYGSLEAKEIHQGRASQVYIEQAALLDRGHRLVRLDLVAAQPDDPFVTGTTRFTAKRDGVLNGFVGWFVAELAPGVVLDTAPGLGETHWAQTYFPFTPTPVRVGDVIEVGFELARDEEEARHVRLTLEHGDTRVPFVIE